jgi:hypothetical protein
MFYVRRTLLVTAAIVAWVRIGLIKTPQGSRDEP